MFLVDAPWRMNEKQDGRLAPAYFSQEYKYFDQHLPTVKNETSFKIYFTEVFYKHQFNHWFLYSMHDFSFKIFCLTVPKNFVGEHFGVSENVG